MNINKILSACVGLVVSSQLYANNEIKIMGNVIDSTCVLKLLGGSGSTNGNIAVVLDNVLNQSFASDKLEQGAKEFTLQLKGAANGTECDAFSRAQLKGMTLKANKSLAGTTGVVVNEAQTSAQVNVMIRHDNKPVDLTSNIPIAATLEGDVPTFKFQASYIATAATPVAQSVLATLTYTLNYN